MMDEKEQALLSYAKQQKEYTAPAIKPTVNSLI